jgi:predicted DNA-binding protein
MASNSRPRPVQVRLPAEMHDRLAAAASLNERTLSQEVRIALRAHLGPAGAVDVLDRGTPVDYGETRG